MMTMNVLYRFRYFLVLSLFVSLMLVFALFDEPRNRITSVALPLFYSIQAHPLIYNDDEKRSNLEQLLTQTRTTAIDRRTLNEDGETTVTNTIGVTAAATSKNIVGVSPTTTVDSSSDNVTCKFPYLLIDDPSLKLYLKHKDPLECSSMRNWVYTRDGKFFIDESSWKKYGPFKCKYWNLIRKAADDRYYEVLYSDFKNNTPIVDDAFLVNCTRTKEKKPFYFNVHLGCAFKSKLHDRKPVAAAATAAASGSGGYKPLPMNVYIYVMDSMSRINFIRKCPEFYKTITEEMKGIVMEGFNIVGDGTPWTMIPIITGHFQTELYEARKRFDNSSHLDGWPTIFRKYQNAGFITSFAEEMARFSFWIYKLKGFKTPPTDHFLQLFERAAYDYAKYSKEYCQGDTPRSIVLCNFWEEQQVMYRHSNLYTLSVLFSAETSHDDYNMVQVLDRHWSAKFLDQYRRGFFNDTILILMGDHGRRFGGVRKTQSGKVEEKLPFLAVVLPDWFKGAYPNAWHSINANARQRLVTPFDLHETLNHVLNFNDSDLVDHPGNVSQRGISLFRKVPLERTCKDAWIKPYFCSCLQWETIDDPENEEPIAVNATQFVIGRLNSVLAEAEGLCAPLTLKSISMVRRLHPSQDVMAFKESLDYDNIFPDLTAEVNLTSVSYELQFSVEPSEAVFEALVQYFGGEVSSNEQFAFNFADLTRINQYGEQPHCILATHHNLRPYCYCNDLLVKSKR